MRNFFSNPIVSRITGAIGAGASVFIISHDIKSAAVTAVSFLIYGAVHTTSTAIGDR